jgi:selenocysteine lyase/cysteine desulfurase
MESKTQRNALADKTRGNFPPERTSFYLYNTEADIDRRVAEDFETLRRLTDKG